MGPTLFKCFLFISILVTAGEKERERERECVWVVRTTLYDLMVKRLAINVENPGARQL